MCRWETFNRPSDSGVLGWCMRDLGLSIGCPWMYSSAKCQAVLKEAKSLAKLPSDHKCKKLYIRLYIGLRSKKTLIMLVAIHHNLKLQGQETRLWTRIIYRSQTVSARRSSPLLKPTDPVTTRIHPHLYKRF